MPLIAVSLQARLHHPLDGPRTISCQKQNFIKCCTQDLKQENTLGRVTKSMISLRHYFKKSFLSSILTSLRCIFLFMHVPFDGNNRVQMYFPPKANRVISHQHFFQELKDKVDFEVRF